MGQYYNGEKIGTCENMYYMRLAQAEKLAAAGARDDDGIKFSEYLTDNTTRWRLPWPDEDGREKAGLLYSDVSDFERYYELQVPQDVKINHTAKCYQGNGHNVFLPCIHSEEWDKVAAAGVKLSHGTHYQKIQCMYDAIRDGERAILFECSVCGNLQRMAADDWRKVWKFNAEMIRKPFKTSLHDREDGASIWAQDLRDYAERLEIMNRLRIEWKPGDTVPEAIEALKEAEEAVKL